MDGLTLTAVALAVGLLTSPADPRQLDCATEAVLAESAMAREPFAGDLAVAANLGNRLKDGRWGDSYCEVVNKCWGTTGKGKNKRPARCDYSYKNFKRYDDILKKAAAGFYHKARYAAHLELTGQNPRSEMLAQSLHYQYRAKSSKNGNTWFDCTTKPLDLAHPRSVHMHHRDAIERELRENEKKKACTKYVKAFRLARDKNERRKLLARAN